MPTNGGNSKVPHWGTQCWKQSSTASISNLRCPLFSGVCTRSILLSAVVPSHPNTQNQAVVPSRKASKDHRFASQHCRWGLASRSDASGQCHLRSNRCASTLSYTLFSAPSNRRIHVSTGLAVQYHHQHQQLPSLVILEHHRPGTCKENRKIRSPWSRYK